MDKVSSYDYSELDIHQESKFYFANMVDGEEGSIMECDADSQIATWSID